MSPGLSIFSALSKAGSLLCCALLCCALSASPKGRDAQQLPVGRFPLVSHQADCGCGHSETQRVVITGPWHTAGKSARCEMQQLAASAEHQMPSAMAVCCRHGGHIHGDCRSQLHPKAVNASWGELKDSSLLSPGHPEHV